LLSPANQSPQPKRQTDRFSHFCTALGRMSSGMPGVSFPLIIAPSQGDHSRPHLIMLSWAYPRPQPKCRFDRFSRFCTVHVRVSSAMSVHALPLKSALPIGRSGPNQYMIPWAHPSPHRKRHLDRLSRFCTDDRRVSLYFAMGRPFPLKIAASYGEIWTPSNTR